MYAIKKIILIIEDGRVRYSMNGWYPLLATRQFLSPLIHIRLGYFHKWLIYWKLLAFNCKTNRRPTDRTIDRRARIYYCSVFAYVLIFGWIIFILSIELRAVRWIIDMPIRLAQLHTHTHSHCHLFAFNCWLIPQNSDPSFQFRIMCLHLCYFSIIKSSLLTALEYYYSM